MRGRRRPAGANTDSDELELPSLTVGHATVQVEVCHVTLATSIAYYVLSSLLARYQEGEEDHFDKYLALNGSCRGVLTPPYPACVVP
jgi:hypothetical protein